MYQNDGGMRDSATYFKHILGYLRNQVEAVGKDHVQIRAVDLGDGVDLFQMAAKDPNLAQQIDGLKAQGVGFLICRKP